MSLEKDAGRYKLFSSDDGLFVTLAFKDKKYTENVIYNKLLSDKLEANLEYVYENVVAQMLIARGNNLFYYTMESKTSNHLYEIDFLISVSEKYVVHTKDYKWENGIHYIHSYIDYESSADDWGNWWGSDWVRCGMPGYTAGGGDDCTMLLYGLPDFKTESTKEVGIPEFLAKKWKQEGRYEQEVNELKSYLNANGYEMTVTNCISYWLSSWVREYGVDGFRCDTAKHVELSSWKTLNDMCTEALKTWRKNNPAAPGADWTDDFWMTGESWGHGVSWDEYYSQGGFDSMINFETQGAIVEKPESGPTEMRDQFSDNLTLIEKYLFRGIPAL